MADIEPRRANNVTRYATGTSATDPNPDYRQLGVRVSPEEFTKVKAEALRQDVSMGEVVRQLIDLL